jgi:MoxR-like ATPase
MATQNPIEQEGTYPLPEAQLDRFLLMVKIDYPNASEEQQLIEQVTGQQIGNLLDVSRVETIIRPEQILQLQQLTATIGVDEAVHAYAVRIVRTTRDWQGIRMGAGPRGGINLIRAARAAAVLAGRDFVTPDDIKAVTLPVMRHRIILSPELELEGVTADQVLTTLLEHTEAPRQ